MHRLFGTDGVRGLANEELSVERATQIGRALGTVLSSHHKYRPRVLIGMDTRVSSPMLSCALAAGLCSVGSDCVFLGVVPTPAVAYLVKKYRAKAGVMISASHNPYPYNGIKIFGDAGFKLSDALEEQIESIVLDNTPPCRPASPEQLGHYEDAPYALHDYLLYLSSTATENLEGMHLVIDCANGSSSRTAKELFEGLGAKCTVLSATPDGLNINDHCGSTDMKALRETVLRLGADVGLAFDGDADRFLAVDEKGNEVDGDFIMAILALHLKQQGRLRGNTVVGTVMTNYGFTKFCEREDIRYIAAKVGDRYVLEMLNQEGYVFGGEQSGHIIFREFSTTGDGQLTAVQLLCYMKHSKKRLSELCTVMKKYPQATVNIEADAADKINFFTDEEIPETVKVAENALAGSGRIVVRPSGTEPVIRVMVESEDEEQTERIAADTAEKIRKKLAEYK